jgi:hypothetical protein
MRKVVAALAGGMVASMFSFNAQALPGIVGPPPAKSDIERVRGACGSGFHLDPSGACVRNGVPTHLVVTPYEEPVWPRVYCPSYGYYYSERYGRCVPGW